MERTVVKHMKLPSINGLRAISILIVIIHHLSGQNNIFKNCQNIKFLKPIIDFIQDGQMGVNVFFVISGFLITYLLINEELNTKKVSLKNFYIRRTFRIFPAYYFMLLVYLLLQLFGYIQISNMSWLTSVTYTKYFNVKLDWITGHAWSLSIEEQFYLFWPFVFILGNKFRKSVAFFLVIIVPLFRLYFHYFPVYWINELTIFMRIDSIAVGCLFALYKDEIIKKIQKKWNLIFVLSIVLLFFLRYFNKIMDKLNMSNIGVFFGGTHGTLANFLIALIMMYSIFGTKGFWHKLMNSSALNYIGMISYSLYLWQQFFINNTSNWYNVFPLNLVLIFIVANISYYFVEKPFLKLKDKF